MAELPISVLVKSVEASSSAPMVEFILEKSSDTGSKLVINYRIEYYAYSAARTSVNKDYEFRIGGKLVAGGSYDINGKTGTHIIKSGSYTITKTASAQSLTVLGGFGFHLTWGSISVGAVQKTATLSVTAQTKYTISYNANGGSGAPSSQTKYKDEAIVLSSTKPTRSGYTFQGWGTSSTDTTADYQPGASYTGNATATLYAVWKANTYTVKYNANGGTGAPGNQTKTHGTTLTLSTTRPTRTDYTFLGWATSANGSVAYQPGGSYTTNAAVTLYAKWEVSYVPPRIYNPHLEWVAEDTANLLQNSAGPFTSGTDSNYGYDLLPNSIYSKTSYLESGNTYTLSFDWSVDWAGMTPVTNVEVRIWNGEDSGSPEDVSSSMVIPDLSNKTSGSLSYTFTFDGGAYSGSCGYTIDPIYCSSQNALDGSIWSIRNVRLVEGEGDSGPVSESIDVEFNWETTNSNPTGTLVFYDNNGSAVYTKSLGTLSGTSGQFTTSISATSSSSLNSDTSYAVNITLTDSKGSATIATTLAGNIYPIDILYEGKGISFGKSAELVGVADFGYTAKFTGGIQNIVLNKYNDLNDVKTPNTYVSVNKGATYYTNCPVTEGTFTLEVMSAGAEGQVLQRLTTAFKNGDHRTYIRHYFSGSWGSWVLVDGKATLFSGNSAGAITLSENAFNFEYLEIFFTDNNGHKGGYTKIHSPYTAVIELSIVESAGTVTYIRRTDYSITGASMSPDTTNAGYVRLNNTAVSHTTGTNYIRITRVVGHRS